jgi:hypothetical protein
MQPASENSVESWIQLHVQIMLRNILAAKSHISKSAGAWLVPACHTVLRGRGSFPSMIPRADPSISAAATDRSQQPAAS